jgi:hypothetical protein
MMMMIKLDIILTWECNGNFKVGSVTPVPNDGGEKQGTRRMDQIFGTNVSQLLQ